MPNDILPLGPRRRRLGRLARAVAQLVRRVPGIAVAVSACVLLPSCGEEDDGVTFGDVRPMFNRRCTTCHRPGTPIGVDIQNPFARDTGLVASVNTWNAQYPGETPEFNVVPFDPDNSFLIDKLVGASALPPEHGGSPMPLQIEPLTQLELAAFETWVGQGARDDATFLPVREIIGDENQLGGKCIYCHYTGTPNPPNLTDPFGPDGVVNVKADYRADMDRVVPGDLEGSLLIQKVRANRADSYYGAPMPYSYDPLTPGQIATVRQWILEGARP